VSVVLGALFFIFGGNFVGLLQQFLVCKTGGACDHVAVFNLSSMNSLAEIGVGLNLALTGFEPLRLAVINGFNLFKEDVGNPTFWDELRSVGVNVSDDANNQVQEQTATCLVHSVNQLERAEQWWRLIALVSAGLLLLLLLIVPSEMTVADAKLKLLMAVFCLSTYPIIGLAVSSFLISKDFDARLCYGGAVDVKLMKLVRDVRKSFRTKKTEVDGFSVKTKRPT
jgi:hypothetical protein